MEDTRPDPDALLNRAKLAQGAPGGKLKIFFGYAAGVGKTYAMLEAAHRAKDRGADVAVGYIEPHTRPETIELLTGLELIPPKKVRYKGLSLREFDLDGALARRPQLILVDELAHQNAEGCRHRKRYQDVQELLRAGIDVYTTVNVQHLESLKDVVSSITGVVVNERVPDSVFDCANQVELVDLEPEDLIQRLERGKVYPKRQAQEALGHFFVQKNLAALREIALRRTADRLNRTAEQAGPVPVGAGEHILICLSSAPSNAKVIRTAARMAEAFHCSFTALFVETPGTRELGEENRRRLRQNLKLAEELGARIATVYGEDVAAQIAEYARVSGISKIVIGRSNNRRSLLFPRKNLVDRLTQLAPSMDVHIIPDLQAPYRPPRALGRRTIAFSWLDLGKAVLAVAAATAVGGVFARVGLTEANIITVYILGVLFASVWTRGRMYGALASFLSVLAFNYFFTVPRFTLRADDPGYPVTFAVMLAASFITSSLTIQVKSQARQAARKAYRTEVLLQTSQKLQEAEDAQEMIRSAALQLQKLLERTILFYPMDEGGGLLSPVAFPIPGEDPAAYTVPEEEAVARWVLQNNKHAGAGTNTLPGARCQYLAVRGEKGALAVAAVAMKGLPELEAFEKNLMIAMLDQCGLALEKALLTEQKRRVEFTAQQEALRANLLRAISHDLRTPLTSISGSAGILRENSAVLDEEKKQELYSGIYDDAMWLVGLVENLLSVTRIENGSMKIKMEPELLEEVFQEAVSHLDRRASEHSIRVELKDDMLMAKMDVRLVVQVLINILNNAVKYTPEGSHIVLSAEEADGMVKVRVADDGPGVPDEAKEKLFEMFYTAGNARGDSRRGLGLGLSLCKSIVLSHGGRIWAEDNRPRGTIFCFTLQKAEVALL